MVAHRHLSGARHHRHGDEPVAPACRSLTSIALRDGTTPVFAGSMALNFAAGCAVWLVTRRRRRELQLREGMVLIALVWVGGALFACLPLLAGLGLSFTDAYFESMSALTATGATLLDGLDRLPPSLNVWRAELQWVGGMGVIVLVVAVLPMLGVGGRQISKAEIPGPMKDEQLTPRMTQTAKGLWMIYFALTFACLVAYRVAGMTWIDALIHSFSTLSLGGFSSHDASLAFFDSVAIELVAIVFMTLAGINFATHFQAWRARSVRSLPRRLGAAVVSRGARGERRGHYGLPLRAGCVPGPADDAALRRVQHGLGRDQYRLRDGGLRADGRYSRRCGSCSSARSSRARARPAGASR